MELIITYDLDEDDNHAEFKKELIKFFEGKEREVENWMPDSTIIVKTNKKGIAKELGDKLVQHFDNTQFNIKKIVLGILSDFDYLGSED